jgi:hypothetical protein
MSTEAEPHDISTNLRIVGYLICSALTLVGTIGFVLASIFAAIQGLTGAGWFSARILDFVREPSWAKGGIRLAVDWIWKNWIGWPFLVVTILAAALTLVLALSLGNEPER